MSRGILIVGATSAIAVSCARLWAAQGASFILAGRDVARLEQVAADLKGRGAAETSTLVFDITAHDGHEKALQLAFASPVDIVLVATGSLPDQGACEADQALMVREISANSVSVMALVMAVATRMKAQGQGTIAVISSVAGDRGRYSNYIYGSAKAALSTFCDGLRARLVRHGVHVLTIKPGIVATPMTAGLTMPGPLVSTPERVGRDIVAAVARKADVLYTPGYWRLIMWIIRMIPAPLFKRMKF